MIIQISEILLDNLSTDFPNAKISVEPIGEIPGASQAVSIGLENVTGSKRSEEHTSELQSH